MAINLNKGQRVTLSSMENRLNGIIVGMGWDKAEIDPYTGKLTDIDCDLSAIICGLDNHAMDAVYFGKNAYINNSVVYAGDSRTGQGDGDNELIYVHLSKLPENVGKIVVVANIYDAKAKYQHFGMIKNAFVRIINWKTGEEMCRYNLTENYNHMTGIIAAEIIRYGNGWEFEPKGVPVAEASRLQAIYRMYQ